MYSHHRDVCGIIMFCSIGTLAQAGFRRCYGEGGLETGKWCLTRSAGRAITFLFVERIRKQCVIRTNTDWPQYYKAQTGFGNRLICAVITCWLSHVDTRSDFSLCWLDYCKNCSTAICHSILVWTAPRIHLCSKVCAFCSSAQSSSNTSMDIFYE